jgi:phosphopantetheinyl transferase (holo-ACP synthase)
MGVHAFIFAELVAKQQVTISDITEADIPYLRVALGRERARYNDGVRGILGESECLHDAFSITHDASTLVATVKLVNKLSKKTWGIVRA